jgi:hypothetical protein
MTRYKRSAFLWKKCKALGTATNVTKKKKQQKNLKINAWLEVFIAVKIHVELLLVLTPRQETNISGDLAFSIFTST